MRGVLRTAATSAAMISAPARSPATRTMRWRECAASRPSTRRRSRRGRTARRSTLRSSMRAPPRARSRCWQSARDQPGTRRDRVATCSSGVSSSPTAAAMPPCAQTLDAPSPPSGAAVVVTGPGHSASARKQPGESGADDESDAADVGGTGVHGLAAVISVLLRPRTFLPAGAGSRTGLNSSRDHPLDRSPALSTFIGSS